MRVSQSLLKGKSYFDHDTPCKAYTKEVTLRINANGLIVCREWKGCEKQGEKRCAETYYRARLNMILSGSLPDS